MFAQLIKHFGWDPMYQFLRGIAFKKYCFTWNFFKIWIIKKDYEYDIKRKSNLPTNNQEKIDQWVKKSAFKHIKLI
jgi:hypothetical protein